MKLSFYTSTFSDRPLEEVLDFAASAGFDGIEIDVGGHIGVPDKVSQAVDQARDRGLEVSAVTLFGNQLDPDPMVRNDLRAKTRDFTVALSEAGVPIFVLFPGRDPGQSDEDNYADFAAHANELLAASESSGVQIALENWPGADGNFIATAPGGMQRLLDMIPDQRFGVEFDPSHFLRMGIDPYMAYTSVASRVKIVHAKDTVIHQEILQAVGYHGAGWWQYRLPGNGLLDWKRFLSQVKISGFAGTISIEHEDADHGYPLLDLTERYNGETLALKFLCDKLAAA